MKSLFTLLLVVLSITLGGTVQTQRVHAQESEGSVVPAAIESIFSPQRAPEVKTMGLYQRSFVDLMQVARNKLQVALVIDGTTSMGGDLDQLKSALRRMVGDLRLYKGADVSFQIVIYRDTGVAPRHIEFPMNVAGNEFSADKEILTKAIDSFEALSGAPYFPELIDLGIHKAIKELDWDKDETTERWLIVVGDAPPYDEGFEEEKTKARREIWTQELAASAQAAGIKVNCVLCTSSESEYEVAKKVRRKTQDFMATLANETGGKMLDLTYENIRKEIEKVAKKPLVGYTNIGSISRRDVQAVRLQAAKEKAPEAVNQKVRVAVLPHVPMSKISFDPKRPEVQAAADLAIQLNNQGFEVTSTTSVKKQMRRLQRRITDQKALFKQLMQNLNVDYLVYGRIKPGNQGVTNVSTAFYGRDTGSPITNPVSLKTNADAPSSKETAEIARKLMANAASGRSSKLQRLVALRTNQPLQITPTSLDNSPNNPLLAGFLKLEEAVEFGVDSDEGNQLLGEAEALLDRAIDGADSKQAFAHYLLASCYFNQANALTNRGLEAESRVKSRECKRALRQARTLRPKNDLKHEVNGDYELFENNDAAAAIKHYETLLGSTNKTLKSAARAHWMLAGIYAGDWNVDESIVDAEKARKHIVALMAHWSDSSYAKFYKRALNWNESEGSSGLAHLPRSNEPVAKSFVE